MKTVYGLPPRTRYAAMALDLEIFRANRAQLHRPHGDFASLGISDGKTVWMIENVAQVEKAIQRIQGCRLVFHNAGFDVRHLRRWADVPCPKKMDTFWDTYLVERLLWGGWFDSFGLGDLTRRYFRVMLNKETRSEYATATEITPEMRAYAGKDPYYTLKIYEKQRKDMEADPLSEGCWKNIDAPFLWASLDFRGITLDKVKWKNLTEKWRAKADEIEEKLGFNPGSPPQTQQALRKIGVNVGSTEEKFLIPYRDKKVVQMILDYREAAKRASSYGDNILAMVEADGDIYPNFKTIGAETGRTACEGPNLQNQPNEDDYRSCYVARRGERFMSADYSKQEPNILAQLSRDSELLRMLQEGENIYLEVASTVHQRNDIEEYDASGHKSKEYKHGKTLFLGLGYGLTASGLSNQTGLPLHVCDTMVDRFFARFRGIARYIDTNRALGREDGYVRTQGGRRVWLNWYSYQAGNNAINAPMQGTGADMTKLSIVELHRRFLAGEYGDVFPVIGPVHDEIVAACKTALAKKVARDIIKAMEYAYAEFCPDVNAKSIAEISSGRTWAEKA